MCQENYLSPDQNYYKHRKKTTRNMDVFLTEELKLNHSGTDTEDSFRVVALQLISA